MIFFHMTARLEARKLDAGAGGVGELRGGAAAKCAGAGGGLIAIGRKRRR